MNLYFHIEHDDIDELESPVVEAIQTWIDAENNQAILVNSLHNETDTQRLGLTLAIENRKQLKPVLKFLYELAQTHRCDFVVGEIKNDRHIDTCYFGYQEGRPDAFEIANYLGLTR